jgi:hypothetical protein
MIYAGAASARDAFSLAEFVQGFVDKNGLRCELNIFRDLLA